MSNRIIRLEGCYKMCLPEDVAKEMNHTHCPFLFRHRPKPIYGPINPKQYNGKYIYCKVLNAQKKKNIGFGNVQELFEQCPLERVKGV